MHNLRFTGVVHFSRHFLILLTILAAITAAPAPSPSAAMKTVKAAVTPYLTFAPYFIAQDEGYFAEQGLNVEFVRFAASSKALPALLAGDVDVIAGMPYPSYFNAIARGGTLRIVADRNHEEPDGCGTMGILVRKDLVEDGSTTRPQWLKGKKMAASGTSSPATYVTDQLLEEQHLTVADIEIVSIASQPSRIEAFATDAIDIALLNEPHLTRALDTGHVVLLKTAGQARPGLQQGVIVFGPNLLEKDPAAGRAFITAYLKGVRRFMAGKTQQNIGIIANHTGLDEKLLQRVCWPKVRTDGTISVQGILDLQKWFFDRGLIDQVLTEKDFWEPQFAEHAVQILGPAD